MRKYWQIFKISWQNALVYRFNFFMWQARIMISFLGIYWFWRAIYANYDFIGSYSQPAMLTYLLIALVLRMFVFSNVSFNACVEIANGDLNNYLLKPLNYSKNWLARDWADKVLNLVFLSVEIVFLVWLLNLPLTLPVHGARLVLFFSVALSASMMYFCYSFLISAFSFWYPEHDGWPLRFLALMLLEFFAGTAFPLDIFPAWLYQIFKLLPFAYYIFFPAQIYLNRLSGGEIFQGLTIMLLWLGVFIYLTKLAWKKGLQIYGAYGR